MLENAAVVLKRIRTSLLFITLEGKGRGRMQGRKSHTSTGGFLGLGVTTISKLNHHMYPLVWMATCTNLGSWNPWMT